MRLRQLPMEEKNTIDYYICSCDLIHLRIEEFSVKDKAQEFPNKSSNPTHQIDY